MKRFKFSIEAEGETEDDALTEAQTGNFEVVSPVEDLGEVEPDPDIEDEDDDELHLQYITDEIEDDKKDDNKMK